MLKRILIMLILLLVFNPTKVFAGWYRCYNFNGTIGLHPVTLSIQIRPGFFGEQGKKDFNVIGVYKYNQYNNPISLEGIIDFKTNKALLYEVDDTANKAIFEFQFLEGNCSGTWKNLNTNKVLPLHLNYVLKLTDTTGTGEFNNIEILQKKSLKGFYFTGIYSKKSGDEKAHMDKLKIISKKDNTVFQIIDFSKVKSATGNMYTIIYDNVQLTNAKANEFAVSNDIGRVGGLLTITYSTRAHKFKLNPVPELDGPD